MDKPTLIIADLHLSDHTPKLNQLFHQFLQDWQNKANALYILGDLFEVWMGDDDNSETAKQVAIALKNFSHQVPIYFIAGNRDFLLGKHYAQQANFTLLPEHQILSINQHTILLTHGDEMCTEDVSYQRYRRIIRKKMLQKIFLLLPLSIRQRIANNIRHASIQKKQQSNSYQISDVTEQGVATISQQYPNIDTIIHGHTHRPNIHQHHLNQRNINRYVLPDWHDNKGGYILINQQGIFLKTLPENNQ